MAGVVLVGGSLLGGAGLEAQTGPSEGRGPAAPERACPEAPRESAVRLARSGGSAEAAVLLEEMSAGAPGDVSCRGDLVAVLSWAGRHADALRIGADLPPDRLDPIVLEAMGRSARERGRPEEAVRHYGVVVAERADRVESRIGLALSLLEAGRPSSAETRARGLLERLPGHPEAMLAAAHVLRAAGSPAEATRLVEEVLATDPEHEGARSLRDDLRVDALWELSVEAASGRSSGGELGTRDRALRTRLVTPPVLDRVRLFVATRRSEAFFDAGRGLHDRSAVGLIVAARPLRMSFEVGQNLVRSSRPAFAGSLELSAGDRWSLGVEGESESEEVPLQATLQGLGGWRASAGVAYRRGQRWRWRTTATLLRISDGNRRWSAYTAVERELARGAAGRFSGVVEAYAAGSSLRGAPYFNPSRIVSPTASLLWAWTPWRTGGYAFTQEARVTGGVVDQSGYGREAVFLVRYEHHWSLSRLFSLRYGLTLGRPVYDGLRERRTAGHAALVWRLP